jgi:hypothetical protein
MQVGFDVTWKEIKLKVNNGNIITQDLSTFSGSVAPGVGMQWIQDPNHVNAGRVILSGNIDSVELGNWEIALDNICVSVDSAVSDSVWPGDANANGLAEITDVFPIGLAYASTGPVRAGASLLWAAQGAQDWSTSYTNGANNKHADCNGDGLIDQNDLNAILLNYGLSHNKDELPEIYQNAPNLKVDLNYDTVGVSNLVTASIKLGDLLNIADSVYGISFTLNYDPALVDTNSVSVDYQNSWLGDINNANEMISLDTNLINYGRVDIGITRTNQLNKSGQGEVAAVDIIIIDDLSGKQTNYASLGLSLTNVKVIGLDQVQKNVNIVNDSVVISDEPSLSLRDAKLSSNFSLFPNPTSGLFQVKMEVEVANVTVFDILGQPVYSESVVESGLVDISQLPNGIYTVVLENVDRS